MENPTEKKILPPRDGYKLYNNKGDLSKRWFVYFSEQIIEGVYKRRKVYGGINRHNTAEGRYKAAKEVIQAITSGTWQDTFEPEKLTAAIDKLFNDRARTLRRKSKTTYRTKLNVFLEFCGKKRVDTWPKITRAFALAFLKSINRSPTTVNSYRDTLKSFFDSAIEAKYITKNPFAGIKKLSESRRGKIYFNSAQLLQLKNGIRERSPDLWTGCQLLFYCFIRPGELRLLRVEDVNFDEGFIKIHADISKNKKTQVVTIPDAFLPELKKWLAGLPQNYYIVNRAPVPVGRDYLSKQHKVFLKLYGFSSRYSFYSWKHTGAVACVKAGINLKDLQMQMRHHSLDQLNEYLREMGIMDSEDLKHKFPGL